MIRLVFTHNKEVIQFTVEKRVIQYWDRLWKESVQFMPKDREFVRKIMLSRNRLPHMIVQWIQTANSGKNLEEYNNCKTDEELVEIVKRDAMLKGLKFQKRFDE